MFAMKFIKRFNRQESGQTLIMIILILALTGIIIPPLVNFMGTGLKSVRTYHENTSQLYAADAGIKDGIWKITNGVVPKNVDFSQTYPAMIVNNESVVVKIDYTWILSGIADAQFGPHNDWVDVSTTGNANISGIYTISLQYNDVTGNPGNKRIHQMGVVLPASFTYVGGSSSDLAFPNNIDKSEPTVTAIHGSTSIKWGNVDYSFKKSGDIATQQFRFTPIGKIPKGDVAWISSQSNDIGLSWDEMIWTYTITSTATNTSTGKHTTIIAHVSSDTGATEGLAIATYTINH